MPAFGAHARTLRTYTVRAAVVGTGLLVALAPSPGGLALADTIGLAVAMVVAVAGAGLQFARGPPPALLALAFAVTALSVGAGARARLLRTVLTHPPLTTVARRLFGAVAQDGEFAHTLLRPAALVGAVLEAAVVPNKCSEARAGVITLLHACPLAAAGVGALADAAVLALEPRVALTTVTDALAIAGARVGTRRICTRLAGPTVTTEAGSLYAYTVVVAILGTRLVVTCATFPS